MILSPEYAKSPPTCRNWRISTMRFTEMKDESGKKHRIFKVLTQPVAQEEQPDCLKEELSYNFFEINRYNKKAITYDLNGKNGPDDKFWSKLVDLAYDIADTLDRSFRR